VYKFETGEVFGYDRHQGQYDVVGQTATQAAADSA
jgi:hypothetical protein